MQRVITIGSLGQSDDDTEDETDDTGDDETDDGTEDDTVGEDETDDGTEDDTVGEDETDDGGTISSAAPSSLSTVGASALTLGDRVRALASAALLSTVGIALVSVTLFAISYRATKQIMKET